MSLKDISIDRKPFDINLTPWKTPWYLTVAKLAVYGYHKVFPGFKIIRHNMEGIKPPFILLQNHASFIDFGYSIGTRLNIGFVSSIEEFANNGEWLMRSLGCMYKRKFTPDINVVKHIKYHLEHNKCSVSIFPEARFSLAGINEETDSVSYAKLIKLLKVPLVVAIEKGNFIRSPQWNKHPYRKIPQYADVTQIVTKEESETLSVAEIKKRIDDIFVYDDYKYWQDSGVKIKCKKRAQNIHKILYKCPHCHTEFEMDSRDDKVWCNRCHKEWTLTERGFLVSEGETYFTHVPDWYRWEREEVKKEVEQGSFHFEDDVRIEQLITCHKGLEHIGYGKLVLDRTGFTLTGKTDDGNDVNVFRHIDSMPSVHIEYNYRKRGEIIDLATLDQKTYFLYPQNKKAYLTKIHFATEELHKAFLNK